MLPLLHLAADVADLSRDKFRKAFIGCVAVRNDGTIVSSRNGSTVPKFSCKVPAVHAEVRACKKSGYNAVLYVARVRRDGSFAMARPCARCMAMLRSMRVKKVYFTINEREYQAIYP